MTGVEASTPDPHPTTARDAELTSRTPRESVITRLLGWPTLVLFLAFSLALLTLVPLALRTGPMTRVIVPAWLENFGTFAVLLLVGVGGFVIGFGRLRPADLGLGRGKFHEAVVTIGGIWMLNQIIAAALTLATGAPIRLHPAWGASGVGPTLLWAAVMFFLTALFEEIAFRGVLFPQLHLRLRGSGRSRFWIALIVSQAMFAAAHLPGHLVIRNLSGTALLTTTAFQGLAGVLLLLVYLRTRNLWIAVGLHGLANAPTALVTGTMSWEILLLALLIAWPWLARRPAHRGLAGVERRLERTAALGRSAA